MQAVRCQTTQAREILEAALSAFRDLGAEGDAAEVERLIGTLAA
ncbi:MAG: hypothetical protein O7G87_21225 [bacterium]|nr:hypothetical protein [bacterium]